MPSVAKKLKIMRNMLDNQYLLGDESIYKNFVLFYGKNLITQDFFLVFIGLFLGLRLG